MGSAGFLAKWMQGGPSMAVPAFPLDRLEPGICTPRQGARPASLHPANQSSAFKDALTVLPPIMANGWRGCKMPIQRETALL